MKGEGGGGGDGTKSFLKKLNGSRIHTKSKKISERGLDGFETGEIGWPGLEKKYLASALQYTYFFLTYLHAKTLA